MPRSTGISKTGGHKLGSGLVGAEEDKWRCKVCTFLNGFGVPHCMRCQEPTSEDEQARLKVHRVKSASPSIEEKKHRSSAEAPRAENHNSHNNPSVASVARVQPPSSSSTQLSPSAAASKPAPKAVPRSASNSNVHTVKQFAKKQTVKAQPMNKIHQGDLGYTPSKANIHTFTRSKLNHDTVSYRAKFEKEDDDKSQGTESKANIQTLGGMVKNGFISSSAPRPKNKHDETPAPRPAKYSLGPKAQSKGGLLSMLQAAASSDAVASLKHTGTTVMPSVKPLGDGTYTKLAL